MVHELPCTILLNAVGLIYCSGCAAGYKGDRCEIKHTGTATKQTCTPPETGGACQNGSKCNLNSAGFIYCSGSGCPAGYKGDRCEIKPAGTTTKQSCTPPETGGACQNGSKCTLNSAGCIYCANCPAGYTGFRCEKPPAAGKACTSDSDCTAPQQCLVDATNPGPVAGPRNQKCQKQVTCPAGQAKCGFTYYDLAPSFSRSISANTLCCPAGQGCFAPDAGAPSRCFASLGCPSGKVSCGEGITYGYKSNPDNVCCAAGQICSRGGGGGGSASNCVTPPATPSV